MSLLLKDDSPSLSKQIGLMIHLVAVTCAAMKQKDGRVLGLHSEGGVPEIDSGGEIEVSSIIARRQGSKRWLPFPAWKGSVVFAGCR